MAFFTACSGVATLDHRPSPIHRSSTFERRSVMLDSLRRKFSKAQSTPQSLTQPSNPRRSSFLSKAPKSNPMDNNNPFTTSTSPTRRPDRAGMNAFSVPSNEPPPAYTPTPQAASLPAPSGPQITQADDPYAFLGSFDTKFLIDDSGSMAGRSWRQTQRALEAITPVCTAHDADGIDLHFLNQPDRAAYRNVTVPSTVAEIFSTVRPQGGTPTGQRLNKLLKPYLDAVARDPDGTKPLNIIVITDGAPSDDVESVLIRAAKRLDKLDAPAWQVGIQFFQVGNEPDAREHLRQLDDGLAEIAGDDDLRDMVDTVPFAGVNGGELTGEGILKVVLGAVNRRLDRKRSKDLHR